MRILVVGAGALGGYYGGRLAESGADVTFLVRPRRSAQLSATGLRIRSSYGDITIEHPRTLTRDAITAPFDVVMVACKAYDMAATMEDFAPAVGPHTAILPLLNGMQHLQALATRFGDQHVLGGLCMISAVLDDDGTVLHVNTLHGLTFGELGTGRSERVTSFATLCQAARFDTELSTDIMQAMWDKWVFIAAGAGITCLMRAPIGDIVSADGGAMASALYDECAAIAAHNGCAPGRAAVERAQEILTASASPWTSSMLKDVIRGARTEGDAILGDLIARRPPGLVTPILATAYASLRTYEAGRARLLAARAASTLTPG